MIVRGTVYMTDDLDLIFKALSDPMNRAQGRSIMALSLDEMDSELERQYPYDAFKATCLLPPPTAIFHQIDGDTNAFVEEYTIYLQSDVVTDFLSAVFKSLVNGVNIMMYTPSFGEDIVWINIFLQFMENYYGIHIGTSATNNFIYNPNFDIPLANTMYFYNAMDIIEFMIYTPDNYVVIPNHLVSKIAYDLRGLVGDKENPMDIFFEMRKIYHGCPNPVTLKPGITFGL